MKELRIIFFLLFSLVLISCGRPDSQDSEGNPVYFNKHKGKWIILNYWASWCKPCYEEIPQLNKLANNHTEELVIYGVNFDQLSKERIQHFANKLEVDYPLLVTNPGPQFGITDVPNLPATFIISPQGKLVATLYGPQTETSVMQQLKKLT